MAKKKVTDIVADLAQPIVDEEGLELVEVEYKKEGANWFLRVFIDRPEGNVDIEDCGRVSEKLSEILDEMDPIPSSYFLEVCSPGAERPLKKMEDYLRAVGKHVNVTTYEPVEGRKVFEGLLQEVTDEHVVVLDGKTPFQVPHEKIASARLAVVF